MPKDQLTQLTSEELRRMLQGFVAYFGTYTVDLSTNTIIHHVAADVRREYNGSDQLRPFRIVGDELIIGDGRTWLRRFKRQ